MDRAYARPAASVPATGLGRQPSGRPIRTKPLLPFALLSGLPSRRFHATFDESRESTTRAGSRARKSRKVLARSPTKRGPVSRMGTFIRWRIYARGRKTTDHGTARPYDEPRARTGSATGAKCLRAIPSQRLHGTSRIRSRTVEPVRDGACQPNNRLG